MKQINTLLKYMLAISITAALATGCASATYEPGTDNSENENENNNNNTNNGNDMDTDGDGENDTNSGDVNLSDNKCDDFPTYEACDLDDSYTLLKCNADGILETIPCTYGCKDGKCTSKADNSCAEPYTLNLDNSVNGNTEKGDNYPSACVDLDTQMAVVKFDIPEVGFYELTTRRITDTSEWGQALSRTCDPSEAYSIGNNGNCSVGNAVNNKKISRIFNPGTHYLFVAPSNILAPHFKFSASLAKTNENYGYSGKLTPVYISDQGYTTSDTTKEGTKSLNWPGGKGCQSGGINGAEKAYAFAIDKTATFLADLKIDDASQTSLVGMHLYAAKDTLGIVSCAETSDHILYLSAELTPGEYVLLVDGVGSETYDYTLNLTLE